MTARAVAIAVLVALAVAARPAAAAPRWDVVIDRGRLRVSAEAGLGRDARRIADRAERSLARIEADLDGLPRPAVIDVRLVRDGADLAAAAPEGRGAPRWAAGVAYPDVGVVVLALGRRGQRFDLDKTLDHELAHLALGAAVPTAPRWLHEGFAWQHAQELDLGRVETLTGMAWFGGVIPLEDLAWSFPAEEAPASRAYAESYDFVGYLAHRGRYVDTDDDGDRYPFRDFLHALAAGKSPDDAARAAFGADLTELFAEWKADLTRRYLMIPATVFVSGLWLVAALLLLLGWWRRRRRARATLAQWAAAEAAADAARVQAPPATPPWTERDPLDDDAEPDDVPPRWLN